jgi:hypothetical protein
MKTLKTTLTLAALGLVTLLTGCATPNMQASFNRGDEVIYGRVMNVWAKTQEASVTLCGGKHPKYKDIFFGPEFDQWAAETGFCKAENLSRLQQVQVNIGVVNINGDQFNAVTFPSASTKFEKGDIVAVKIYPAADGRHRKPPEILRIAAKAKDATKANGCYWDAGTGVWSGFNQGGAVCEGWHWKNHPFSNPSLLKK